MLNLLFFFHRMHQWKDWDLALRLWVSHLAWPMFFYLCFCAKGWDVNGNGLIYNNRKWKDFSCVPGRSCGLLATAFFFLSAKGREGCHCDSQLLEIAWDLDTILTGRQPSDIRQNNGYWLRNKTVWKKITYQRYHENANSSRFNALTFGKQPFGPDQIDCKIGKIIFPYF